MNYSGLIAKNPFSQNHWHVIPCAIYAKYTLDDLAEWVSIRGVLKRALRGPEAVALGRNCVMFDALRFYAYKSIRQYSGRFNIAFSIYFDSIEFKNLTNDRPIAAAKFIGTAFPICL